MTMQFDRFPVVLLSQYSMRLNYSSSNTTITFDWETKRLKIEVKK